MIKLEHFVTASPEQMEFIIEGMRNPMNSWEKSDSGAGCYITEDDSVANKEKYPVGSVAARCETCTWCEPLCYGEPERRSHILGDNDRSLMQSLANADTDHRKFMRMIPVYVRITAPLYWWKEFDTYKIGVVANSCSTMHKIQEKEFTLEDFSTEHLLGGLNHYDEREVPYLDFSPLGDNSYIYSPFGILSCCIIPMLNLCRERYLVSLKTEEETGLPAKDIWWQIIQLLPSSYNQTRNVMMNYEVLANIYKSRKNHKLDEWREFCRWIEKEVPYSELITGEEKI